MKVTGGQRIDLFGVKKEDLPSIWKDLSDAGMVSGHAYGKALRPVKNLRRKDLVSFRHPELHLARGEARRDALGLVDASQVQNGSLRMSAQLRRSNNQRFWRGVC